MTARLRLEGELPEPSSRPRLALAAKGFRPFFLLAGLFAAAMIPIWLLVFTGVVPPSPYLDPTTWHAHEMVFGFAVAVIAGFLLTAVGNWTKRETLVGAPLLGLAALWVAGRVVIALSGALPRWLPAVVDLAFLPALAVALGRPLAAAKNRRNYVMLAVIGALFAANLVVHTDALGLSAAGSGRHACLVAIDVIVVLLLVMAGRTFPMFTRNMTHVESIRSIPVLDALTLAGMIALTLADAFVPYALASVVLAGAVGVVASARAARWGTWHTGRHPLLWILHAGYAWIVGGLFLRVAARVWPVIPSSVATHALTVGAIGSLTLGMMARVSLGHSGRTLVAARRTTVAFVAITLAAFVRVLGPVATPTHYLGSLELAAALWAVAFGLFVWVYAPLLATPRSDGKPG